MNCGSTNLQSLKKTLIENPADMGFSFDGDADRVIGLDSKGNVVDGDHILFLWGRELMEQKILTDNLLISTQMANLGLKKPGTKLVEFYIELMLEINLFMKQLRKKCCFGR